MPRPASADGTPQWAKQPLALGRAAFKRTDDGSENMAINGENTSNVLIWDGDTTAWTLEAQGTAETYAAHSGTYGLDSGVRSAGQDTRFDSGVNQDIAGSYDSLSFWLQAKAFPEGSRLDIKWKTAGGGTPGSKLDVANYISNYDLDVWQKVTIPIDDFALGDDVAQLELTYAVKGGQQFYFDEFQLNQGGLGPKSFRVNSPTGRVWHVERVVLVISAGDAGWNSTAFANIAAGLDNGLLLKYHKIGTEPATYWTLNCKSNIELFGNLSVVNDVTFADSDLMLTFALEPELSSVLLIDDDEVLDFIVRDDIDSLTRVRAFLHYGEEIL